MIKSLLGEDETTKKDEIDVSEKKSKSSAVNSILPDDEIESVEDIKAAILAEPKTVSETKAESVVEPFEVDKPIGLPKAEGADTVPVKNTEINLPDDDPLVQKAQKLDEEILAIEKELGDESPDVQKDSFDAGIPNAISEGKTDLSLAKPSEKKIHISQKPYTPETPAETARKSGLAFSAGISLFAAVVFMMILGWFVDLYVGSSPWGIVGGITIGAVIGFVQFFRTTRQILNPDADKFEKNTLFSEKNKRDLQ